MAATAGLSLVATAAGATVVSGKDPNALASAMVSGATVAGSSLAVDYACEVDDPTTPEYDETNCPTGIGTSPMAGFPTHGTTFTILTSGNAALADDANTSSSSGESWGQSGTPIAGNVFDQQVLRVDLGAATGSCLAFDFRFLSEEYPEFVQAGFNDAFIAQLNTWSVTVDAGAQTINAPGNFAAGAGDTISVDASGPSAMLPEYAAGSTYDGATLPLVARAPVAPGSTNSLYLTIFDQGDGIYDSAVFLDNLRYETLPPNQCKSLALDPFEGTTGVSPASNKVTFGADKATLNMPFVCNLPPGPINCTISASASFTPWGQKVARKGERQPATTTPLASGAASIPAGGSGTLSMATTAAGLKAVKAAQQKPAKLKKKAKKLLKKAKTAPPAKAKKLVKKAKKLKKLARKLKKKPLGTVSITVSNASNGASEVINLSLPR